jgi:hypothetical protein
MFPGFVLTAVDFAWWIAPGLILTRPTDSQTPGLSDRQAGELPCTQEDPGEHGAVEPAGVGVAQGGVIGGEQMQAIGQKILGSVSEAVLGFAIDDAVWSR